MGMENMVDGVDLERVRAKRQQAIDLLERCIGEKGVWADPVRYKDTCWTRDTACAILPAMLVLRNAGHPLGERVLEALVTFVENLFAKQRPDGSLPIVFLDNEERWVAAKEQQERDRGREPFMLKRYREGQLENLTPGTHDSEIWGLHLAAVLSAMGRPGLSTLPGRLRVQMMRAMDFVLANYFENGLLVGADWRDTMHDEFMHTPLLTNNVICLQQLRMMANRTYKHSKMHGIPAGEEFPHERYQRAAENLERRIRETFVRDGRLIDFPTDDPAKLRFDPLGASYLAFSTVLKDGLHSFFKHDAAFEAELAKMVPRGITEVDSPCGVTIKCKHKAYRDGEQEVIDRTDGVVVWPFVVGYTCWAFAERLKMRDVALDQYRKLLAHDGFAEYYDPQTGKGWGAREQLWSACLFLVATDALFPRHDWQD